MNFPRDETRRHHDLIANRKSRNPQASLGHTPSLRASLAISAARVLSDHCLLLDLRFSTYLPATSSSLDGLSHAWPAGYRCALLDDEPRAAQGAVELCVLPTAANSWRRLG